MKLKRIHRPVIELEYKGLTGFVEGLIAICRVGIKRCTVNLMLNGKPCGKKKAYIIPKYKFVRAKKDKNI